MNNKYIVKSKRKNNNKNMNMKDKSVMLLRMSILFWVNAMKLYSINYGNVLTNRGSSLGLGSDLDWAPNMLDHLLIQSSLP